MYIYESFFTYGDIYIYGIYIWYIFKYLKKINIKINFSQCIDRRTGCHICGIIAIYLNATGGSGAWGWDYWPLLEL